VAKEMTKFNPVARLQEHMARVIGRHCSRADLIEVMRLTRLILERQGATRSFPHLALYCDWVVHGEIDRHELGWKIIEQMNAAVTSHDETKGASIAAGSQAISLPQLRAEMIVLFSANDVRTELPDSFSNWKTFVGILMDDLCERRVAFPTGERINRKKKAIIDQAITRMKAQWSRIANSEDCWASEFFINKGVVENPDIFCWNLRIEASNLTGANSFLVRSTVGMIETAVNFKNP
jgi:hypothetical protein